MTLDWPDNNCKSCGKSLSTDLTLARHRESRPTPGSDWTAAS